ncbi:MAG: type I methionyl aminopeptidase [Candidatus Omnitrophica bacterium]|nr:type I methionyl aminopeptidase [Candidatus Omnitrophota bacterium]
MIELKSPSQLQIMRRAGRVVGEILEALREAVRPGISTLELDELALRLMIQRKSKPAFKGYRGFPAHICTSINEEVVHGIPSQRRLKEGDIVGLDVGVVVDGYYGDAAITVPVGQITAEAARLLQVTEESLAAGIAMATTGNRLSDISHAVQQAVESKGYSVVREFVGHGIGTQLHELPQIPNYGKPGSGPRLKEGMVLAIEPMVNQGGPEIEILPDGWTAVTKDGKLAAHFEHTVAVTSGAPEILTECQKKKLFR